MSTAKETIEAALRGEGCLGKAADDEPVFVLRAQDLTAPERVLDWAIRVQQLRGEIPKTIQARSDAVEMRDWQRRNYKRVKVPD